MTCGVRYRLGPDTVHNLEHRLGAPRFTELPLQVDLLLRLGLFRRGGPPRFLAGVGRILTFARMRLGLGPVGFFLLLSLPYGLLFGRFGLGLLDLGVVEPELRVLQQLSVDCRAGRWG